MGKVKEKYGLSYSAFFPIASEPEDSHPVYAEAVDLGAAVKAYLTINYAEAKLPGDDVIQLELKEFTGGQLDAETLLNDLEVESKLYGSRYENGMLSDNKNDRAASGGYAYIQKLATKTKNVCRAVFLYKATPRMNADNSDTKGESLTFSHNAVSYGITPDNTGDWRVRQDFGTEAEAKAFLQNLTKAVSGGAFAISLQIVGEGSSPQVGTAFIPSGQSHTVSFATAPVKLYDGAEDVTGQLSGKSYSIANVSADHRLIAIF